jgi:2-iminobutanoate/2-iminopropanoate deaminase
MIKVESHDAPKAIGPYSQAVRSGQLLFVSGQIPLNPKTGKIEEASIEGQTRQVFANLKAILTAAGCTFDDVVRAEVYLKDLQDFQAMNLLYAEYFSGPIKPARQAMQVAKLPLDARIEISCIAVVK